jgi:hypothetical protein
MKLLKALSTRSPMHENLTLLPKQVFNLASQMNLYILADAYLQGREEEPCCWPVTTVVPRLASRYIPSRSDVYGFSETN